LAHRAKALNKIKRIITTKPAGLQGLNFEDAAIKSPQKRVQAGTKDVEIILKPILTAVKRNNGAFLF
jgi:hypothetical protein